MANISPPSDVFLLTTAESTQNGIGTIFIRDILARVTDIKILWFTEPPFLLRFRLAGQGKLGRILNSMLVRIGPWQDLRLHLFIRFKLKQRVNAIEKAYGSSGARMIWATASSPELICIAAHLADRGHDIRATVWDAPEYLLQNLRLSRFSCALVMNHFDRLLSNARGCSVVSSHMQKVYSKRFPQLNITILRHGMSQMRTSAATASSGPIRFVFAGSLYSKNEWNAFVEALELSNWRIAGREVQLAFIGDFPLKGAKRPVQLDYYGPMPLDATMQAMMQMDIGYLPYWLDSAKEFVARTSFPGKMTAYTAAGLSVFHHGPRTSSVTQFLASYPYGVACDSLDPCIVLRHLERLVKSVATPEHRRARQEAMNNALSDSAMIEAFRQLIASPAAEPTGRRA